ncbi:unnamed protein product, partial [Rotaria sp. Silwood1]
RSKLFELLGKIKIPDKDNLYELALDNVAEYGWLQGLQAVQKRIIPKFFKALLENIPVSSDTSGKPVQPKVEAPISVNDQSCVFGQDIQISWKFNGIGKLRVTWFFNGQPLPTNDRLRVTETDDGTSILSILQAELGDQGIYTARATNAFGETEAQTTLNIDCIKPVINTNLNTALKVTKGEILTLKVVASGTPKPHIVWMRDNDKIVPDDRIQVTTQTGDDGKCTLTILNVQPEDEGEYSAMISNVGGSLQSDKCKVIVSKSPMFIVKPTTQKVRQGETAVFVSNVDGYPTPIVTWLLNGKLLTEKEGIEVQFYATTDQAKLSIQNVDLEQHAGSITCRVENEYGEQEETVRFDILVAPKITEDLPKQQEIVSGRDIALKVVGQGSPRPSPQWFFEDQHIGWENASEDEAKNEYQLVIKQATAGKNEGTYRIVLKNEVGEVQSTPCAVTVLEPA